MTETAAIRQDIRPLQIGLLNLMPNKLRTELQMARLLGASPLQVELSLIRIGDHKPKNTSEDHMLAFYQTWETAKDRKFDGFIITGTPVETIPYEDVTYWPEMQRIFAWTQTNVHSTMAVCWGAMAALYHFHKASRNINSRKKPSASTAKRILKPASLIPERFLRRFLNPDLPLGGNPNRGCGGSPRSHAADAVQGERRLRCRRQPVPTALCARPPGIRLRIAGGRICSRHQCQRADRTAVRLLSRRRCGT